MCGKDEEMTVNACYGKEAEYDELSKSPSEKQQNNVKNEKESHQVTSQGGTQYGVVVGAFISYFIADGWAYSIGILFAEFLDYFQDSHGKTAVLAGLVYAVPLTISPFICAFCNLYGCRIIGIIGSLVCCTSFVLSSFASSVEILTLLVGVFSSVGLSMIYLAALLSVTYHFDNRQQGLAIGLAVTGSGLGAFAFPPLVEMIIEKYAWRGALFLIGGIFLNVIPASALFRPKYVELQKVMEDVNVDEKETAISKYSSKVYVNSSEIKETSESHLDNHTQGSNAQRPATLKSSHNNRCDCCQWKIFSELKIIKHTMLDKKIFTNGYYLIFLASTFIAYLWVGLPYVYLVDYANQLGFQQRKSVFLLSVIGIARTFGQIVLGVMVDQTKIIPTFLYSVSIGLCGIGVLFIPISGHYSVLCILCLWFGFFVSATYTLQIICLVKMMGLEKGTNAFGFLQLIEGQATFLGTPLAGWMFDSAQNYSVPFFTAGSMLIFSALLLLPAFVKLRARQRSESKL